MACICPSCKEVMDCGDTVCAICECQKATPCADGIHCEQVIKEVKPNVYLVRQDDGKFGLKWIPNYAH